MLSYEEQEELNKSQKSLLEPLLPKAYSRHAASAVHEALQASRVVANNPYEILFVGIYETEQ